MDRQIGLRRKVGGELFRDIPASIKVRAGSARLSLTPEGICFVEI